MFGGLSVQASPKNWLMDASNALRLHLNQSMIGTIVPIHKGLKHIDIAIRVLTRKLFEHARLQCSIKPLDNACFDIAS